MEESYNLILSPQAEYKLDLLLTYLLTEWGITVQQGFLDEFQHCISIIRVNPYAFPLFLQETGVRQCVVTPLNKIFYAIEGTDIIILSVEDVRMDPRKFVF